MADNIIFNSKVGAEGFTVNGTDINDLYATKKELEDIVATGGDGNTKYELTKSGSTITLTGSDGSSYSVTDADTHVEVIDSLDSTDTTRPASANATRIAYGTASSAVDLANNAQATADSKLSLYNWDGATHGKTWSRVCYVAADHSTVGTSFIFSAGFTRGNVVANATFLITVSHAASNYANIVQLSSGNYTSFKLRCVCPNYSNCFIEIYDDANGISTSDSQHVYCQIIPIRPLTVEKYGDFVDGTTIPAGFTAYEHTVVLDGAVVAKKFVGALDGTASYANSAGYAGFRVGTDPELNNYTETGIYSLRTSPQTNGEAAIPSSNWGTLIVDATTGTPYQIYIEDAALLNIYKRQLSENTWSKISAGYADTAGNANTVDGYSADAFVLKRSADGTCYTGLGTYYNSGDIAAYIKISFPSVPSWTMLTMELTIRQDYSSGKFGKLIIYANQSEGNVWHNFYAVTSGRLDSVIHVYGSDRQHIYVSGVCAWGGLSVDRMLIGDSAVSSDLTNISITGVSSLPETYQTAAMSSTITSETIGSQSVANSDTVDGYHAESFVLKSGDTMSGSLLFSTGVGNISFGGSGLPIIGGAHIATGTLAIGANGIGISGTLTRNDGAGIFLENGGSEEANKLVIALGDDSANAGSDGDGICFRYYDTAGNATYESKIPFKSGTIALTSDIPTSLPASDVYSWAKASSKPSYSWNEIGSRPTALSQFTNDSGFITSASIPSVGNGTLTITQNGVSKGTFTANQSGNVTIALTDDNTTYSAATIYTDGLMSADDKTKLDNLATEGKCHTAEWANNVAWGMVYGRPVRLEDWPGIASRARTADKADKADYATEAGTAKNLYTNDDITIDARPGDGYIDIYASSTNGFAGITFHDGDGNYVSIQDILDCIGYFN